MENNGREYRFQIDFKTADGSMFHVRADDLADYMAACEELGIPYKYDGEVKKPETPAFVDHTAIPVVDTCATCGAALLPEKRIVAHATGKAFWVRDCSSGNRDHKGPIRPAA